MSVIVQGRAFGRPFEMPLTGEYQTGSTVDERIEDGEEKSFGLGIGPDGLPIEATFGSNEEGVQFSVQGNAEVALGGMPISGKDGTTSTEVEAKNPSMPNFYVSARRA